MATSSTAKLAPRVYFTRPRVTSTITTSFTSSDDDHNNTTTMQQSIMHTYTNSKKPYAGRGSQQALAVIDSESHPHLQYFSHIADDYSVDGDLLHKQYYNFDCHYDSNNSARIQENSWRNVVNIESSQSVCGDRVTSDGQLNDLYVAAATAPYHHEHHHHHPSRLQQQYQSSSWLINKLDTDVLERIFQLLDRSDLIRCASVCRSWQCFLLEWPYFWRKINTAYIPQNIQSLVYKILHRETIECLSLQDNQSPDKHEKGRHPFVDEVFSLMANTNYSQLKGLYIKSLTEPTDVSNFTKALVASSFNLTSLHITECSVASPELVFGPIIDGCPLLLDLYYKQRCQTQPTLLKCCRPHSTARTFSHHCDRNSANKTKRRLALRKLLIDLGGSATGITAAIAAAKLASTSSTTVSDDGSYAQQQKQREEDPSAAEEEASFLSGVLRECTSLQLLVWNPADYSAHQHDAIFRSMNTYCPHIQWMVTTTTAINLGANDGDTTRNNYGHEDSSKEESVENIFDQFTQDYYIPPIRGKPHQGLTRLDISVNTIVLKKSTLDAILQKHCFTLETIDFPYDSGGVDTLFWKALEALADTTPLVNLRKLSFNSFATTAYDKSAVRQQKNVDDISTTAATVTGLVKVILQQQHISKPDSLQYHSSHLTTGKSLLFQSMMLKLVNTLKHLQSISFNGSATDKDICLTPSIIERLMQLRQLKRITFRHCFTSERAFINGLEARLVEMTMAEEEEEYYRDNDISNSNSNDVYRKTGRTTLYSAAVSELTLDCKLLLAMDDLTTERLVSKLLSDLVDLRVAHSETASLAHPCACQCSAILYKLLKIRKKLNSRGGDLYSC